jgi:hypothetical protein
MLPLLVAVAGAEAVVAFLMASGVPPLVRLGQQGVELCRSSKGARVVAKTVTGAFVVRLASDVSSTLRRTERSVADPVLVRSQVLEIALICKRFGRHLETLRCNHRS